MNIDLKNKNSHSEKIIYTIAPCKAVGDKIIDKLHNEQRTVFDTCGIIVRGTPLRIKEVLDHIQNTPDMYLVFHKTSKMKLRLVEEAFGEENLKSNDFPSGLEILIRNAVEKYEKEKELDRSGSNEGIGRT